MKKLAAAVLAGSALALLATPAQAATVHVEEPFTCRVDPDLPEYTFCMSLEGQINTVYNNNIYIYSGKLKVFDRVTTPDGTFTQASYYKFSDVFTKVGSAQHSRYYTSITSDWGTCIMEGAIVFAEGEVKHSIETVECTPA